MILVREATPADGPALVDFFIGTPMEAGTAFVLDRGPDFYALLRLRGPHRVFLATRENTLVGTATALWHEDLNGSRPRRLGEVIDLRVAPQARGGRTSALLLGAVRRALEQEGVDWVSCVIGAANRAAMPLARGRAGLPPLRALSRYASVHFIAWGIPAMIPRGVVIRPAGPDDADLLSDLAARATSSHQNVTDRFPWPDPQGMHRGWLALDSGGAPIGGLVVWDGARVRRIRIQRYTRSDRWLKAGVNAASLLGLTQRLPRPGAPLRLWASRWLGAKDSQPRVARALVSTAIAAAARDRQHIVQINLTADDRLLAALPRSPHSTYWSTVYGGSLRGDPAPAGELPDYHADLALV